MCNIDIAILFLTLASMMMMALEGVLDALMTILSSCWICAFKLLSFCLLNKLKENWFEKLSITLLPGENLEWRGTKEGKTSLNLLSILTRYPLIRDHCRLVRKPSEDGCWEIDTDEDSSIRDWMRWLKGSECVHSCDLPPNFWRWSFISISPAIASIPNVSEVLKASKIHRVALLCIFSSIFKGYDRGVWL